MITHIVTFKMTDRSPEHLAHCKSLLDGLLGIVPSLESMVVGINIVESPQAYDLGLIAHFEDLEGLEEYQVHPAHVEVATYLRSSAEAASTVDFEN